MGSWVWLVKLDSRHMYIVYKTTIAYETVYNQLQRCQLWFIHSSIKQFVASLERAMRRSWGDQLHVQTSTSPLFGVPGTSLMPTTEG